MKPALQLKISQSLTMTPQLQQAIRLLQLSSLDLQAEIQEALESNPLLEVDNEAETGTGAEEAVASSQSETNADSDTSEILQQEKMDELVVDTQWEDWGFSGASSSFRNDEEFPEYQGETTESLRDKILWQLDMMPLSETDRAIAMILVDAMDDRGYIQVCPEDVVDIMLDEDGDESITVAEVMAILHLIQSFEPAGIGARDLRECLALQLRRRESDDPIVRQALKMVEQDFDKLSARNYKALMRKYKINEEQLRQIMALIQSLDPRPGGQLVEPAPQYIVPDVFVRKNEHGQWVVELNPDNAPKLRINSVYASLIKRANDSADNVFLKNNLQEAKWFIKSLMSRNETLLKVAKTIVDKQIGFFEYGEEAMKPLVLADVASEVNMHESTISRVTTQKYMHTPRGIFELKYFFSSHVGTAAGGECSSTAIRAVIKKLIANENPKKPLSDSKIATLLNEQGIKVARRTVAKYREAMSIPPSNERKALL